LLVPFGEKFVEADHLAGARRYEPQGNAKIIAGAYFKYPFTDKGFGSQRRIGEVVVKYLLDIGNTFRKREVKMSSSSLPLIPWIFDPEANRVIVPYVAPNNKPTGLPAPGKNRIVY
jgi:hypothetical protein